MVNQVNNKSSKWHFVKQSLVTIYPESQIKVLFLLATKLMSKNS